MQRRREKYAKMEEEREKIRQGIREKVTNKIIMFITIDKLLVWLIKIILIKTIKYNIKKKEEFDIFNLPEMESRSKPQGEIAEEGEILKFIKFLFLEQSFKK
jgi:hypothetical protein